MLKIKTTARIREKYGLDCTDAAISHNEEELWTAGYTRIDLFEATQDRLLHYDGACIGFAMGERLCFTHEDKFVTFDGRIVDSVPEGMILATFRPAKRCAFRKAGLL